MSWQTQLTSNPLSFAPKRYSAASSALLKLSTRSKTSPLLSFARGLYRMQIQKRLSRPLSARVLVEKQLELTSPVAKPILRTRRKEKPECHKRKHNP